MQNQFLNWIKLRWRLLTIFLWPLLLLPLPIIDNSPQARCGYIVLILIIFWVFEVIPLPVTSVLPLALFPLAGILDNDQVAAAFFKDIIVLFFGSLLLAYAIESVNLHRRIALFVLSHVGTSTKWAMAGLMGVTAFLSMWINNSAAASIMLPVSIAISDELERHGKTYHDKKQAIKEATAAVNEVLEINETEISDGRTTKEVILDAFHIEEPKTQVTIEVKQRFSLPCGKKTQLKVVKPDEKKYEEIKKAFLLATAYSATIGGLASLVGTAPNTLVKGFAEARYKDTNFHINFLNFLLFALPVAVLMLIACWIWLQIFYNRKEFFQCRTDAQTQELKRNLKAMLVKQYKELGKPNWSEYSVAIVLFILVLLWVTKEFGGTHGWDIIFRDGFISEATVAVLFGALPLILPNANPFQSNWKYEPIVTWRNLSKSISWGTIFLLGAGLTIAEAFIKSGLSDSVAQALKFLNGVPLAAVVFLIIVISALFTEVTSNVSTASIFLPVLDAVARSSGIHPAYLILPCTLAVSLAFMLPVATPPNAIVFASGHIRVIDMVKTGVVMNIIGFLVIFLASLTWMPKIYGITDESTEIFYNINTTTLATTVK
ncbi:unnamed protein product [Adineta steineri]|uniref:Uncharacterized protein n=1 Tax=Adineta steineri TaxID=433720 RepID=A0A815DNU9_9BILA|nr:unnamed protein product [Adineta steineri]CAF3606501.1 unnamed protein product [Adineta steineri]